MSSLAGVTLARLAKIEVSNDNGSTYVTLSGVKNWSPKTSTKTDDISSYDANGVNVNMPVGAEYTVDVEGVETFVTTTPPYTLDPGLILLYTAGQQYGDASRLTFRVSHTDTTNYSGNIVFDAYVMLENQGGGDTTVAQKWKAKLGLLARPTGTGYWAHRFGVA